MSDLLKPAIIIGCLGATRYMDSTNETTLFYARIAFLCGVLLSFVLLGLTYLRIKHRHDTTSLLVNESDLDPSSSSPLASIVGQNEGGKQVETNNEAYDLLKLRQAAPQYVITPVVVAILHLWFGYFPPLVIQSVLPVVNTLTSELARIHLWSLFSSNAAQAKDLKRPWKAKSLMAQFREMKKEVMKELNETKGGAAGGIGAGAANRRNKKEENRRKLGK